MFSGKVVLSLCSRFTGEHLCQSLIAFAMGVLSEHLSEHHFMRTPMEGYFCTSACCQTSETYLGSCQISMIGIFNSMIDVWLGPKYNSECWDVLLGKGESGEKQPYKDVLQSMCSLKFHKSYRKTLVWESLF